ncbi:MAG TPA: gluconate 2-dehydrogenase subunit 3 family protein [Bryobacteraceae bacterium]|jgi:hypothetical protein|nr:gluconate 2-dehydrogenase subunit 3 family protein [Bryobacteraceae bacterium]
MKRRTLLRSIAAIPSLAAGQTLPQRETTAARDKGLPAGPTLIPPGVNETPTIPVIPADETSDSRIRTFDGQQLAALARLGEVLVPAWDGKPGAAEAGAAEFLDFLVGSSPANRIELYKSGLDELNRRAQQQFGKPFAAISQADADSLLAPLREKWSYGRAAKNDFEAFLLAAKGDLLRATVNSRPYINAVSQERRPRNASNFFWYPIS